MNEFEYAPNGPPAAPLEVDIEMVFGSAWRVKRSCGREADAQP
jgi:hypothetical protein